MIRTTLIAAISLDGFIAKRDQSGTAFTSAADKAHFARALRDHDCQIMGRKSYEQSRDRIQASSERSWDRLILTSEPERYVGESKPGQIEFLNATPGEALATLEERGRERCALLGGGKVYLSFLREDLVDELWITIEAKLFGEGVRLIDGELDRSIRLVELQKIGPDTILANYQRR